MSEVEVLDAFAQEHIKTLAGMNEDDAFSCLARADHLMKNRSLWLPTSKRIEILEKAAQLVADNRELLALEAAKEGGKPLVDSFVEVDRGVEGIKVAVKELAHLGGREIPMDMNPASAGRLAYTRRVPRGVVLAISAFNHPFNLIVHQAIPAIAVGCPVLIKPAATTPLSCQNLLDILYTAGLPKEWCQMVLCENDVAEKLVSDPRVSFLTFIGSAKVGWYLRSKLPPGAACALEHGGAAPVIVDSSADLEKAYPLLVKGGFYHAGQVCVSVQRIFVHQQIEKEFVETFAAKASTLKVGDPSLESTDVGPLILPREVDRVEAWVREAVEQGAKLVCGGKRISDTCFAPTVLLNPSKDSLVARKEIFGPVVCIFSYESLSDAIQMANDTEYAFQAAIFSNDHRAIFQSIEELEGLAIMVNEHSAFRVDWMPFGGYRQSGLGVGGIGHSMLDMTLEKMFVIRLD